MLKKWFAVGKRVRATEVSSEGAYLGSFGFDEHGAMEVDANGLLSENETEPSRQLYFQRLKKC